MFFCRDTAGQERFMSIAKAYYRGAHGIMLVYDVTNESSFKNVVKWIRSIDDYGDENVQRMIVGNKCDLQSKRVIAKDQGNEVACKHGIRFMETSAKSNTNIEQAFSALTEAVMNANPIIENRQNTGNPYERNTVNPQRQEQPTPFKSCCI